jgi:hypothetical protein
VRPWSGESSFRINSPEICVSLQKDAVTKPLRPYGFILNIDRGGIKSAFDRDVTSQYNEHFEKELKIQSAGKKRHQYDENELDRLMENTKNGSHNEIWVKGDKAEIVGAYIFEEQMNAIGANVFLKACRKNGVQIKIIKNR